MTTLTRQRAYLSASIQRQIVLPFAENRRRIVPECLFRLRDGRWMLAYNDHYAGVDDESPAHIRYLLSDDDGATWSKPRTLIDHAGHHNVFAPSIARLQDGSFGLTFGAFDDWDSQHFYFCHATDPLGSWSAPVRLTASKPGYHVNAGQRLIQLRSGRLIQPVNYAPSETPGRGIAHVGLVWRSDNNGLTWRCTEQPIRLPMRGVMEPVVVELRDGRLLMFARNQLGAVHRSVSADGGETWSAPQPTPLESPESCCFLTRIGATGDLAVVWNHSRYDPTYDHYGKRCPLTISISQDEGDSWSSPVDLETDERHTYGMPVAAFTAEWALFAYYYGHGHQCSGQLEGAFARCRLSVLYDAAGVRPSYAAAAASG